MTSAHYPDLADGLDDALQDLSEMVGRPLAIVDTRHRLLAYSIHESPVDRQRLAHMLSHSDTWPTPATGTATTDTLNLPQLGPVVFHRLLGPGKRIIGHVVAPGGDNVAYFDEPAVAHLARLLNERQLAVELRDAQAAALTRRLIDGDTSAGHELIDQGSLADAPGYCAVALGTDPRRPQSACSREALERTLRFVADTSTATVVGAMSTEGPGVLVFPRPVVAERLARIISDLPVRAGIGELVPLDGLDTSLSQARNAWRAAWFAPADHAPVTLWRDAGTDAVLAALPVESFTTSHLPAATLLLLESDISADVVATLETYLDAGGDARATARRLHIHRSTLYYRLDKVTTLLGVDLSDGRVRRDLHLGLRLATLAGLRRRRPQRQGPAIR